MGADALIYVKLNRDVSDDEVRLWSWQAGRLLGYNGFVLDESMDSTTIRIVPDDDCVWIDPEPGWTVLEYQVLSRYWGPGYHRGDFPLLITTLSWLKMKFPDGRVFYGSDYQDKVQELTDDGMAELWHHAIHAEHGYQFCAAKPDGPMCPRCRQRMSSYGYMAGAAVSWTCTGCNVRAQADECVGVSGVSPGTVVLNASDLEWPGKT